MLKPPDPSRRAYLGLGLATLLTGPALAKTSPAWPGGARAAVSLTYDDGLNSQLRYAVPALDSRGLKATFFVTEENMDGRVADWQAVAASGHEIADHTVDHPCSLGRFGAAQFDRLELRRMESFLTRNFGDHRVRTYAYPCGYLGLGHGDEHQRYGRYQRILRREFVGARTTAGGPNLVGDVRRDAFHLHAFEPTYDADLTAPALRYLARTLASGGWAILVFHDVVPAWRGEGDASTRVHEAILDMVQAADVWAAPVGAVLGHIDARPPHHGLSELPA